MMASSAAWNTSFWTETRSTPRHSETCLLTFRRTHSSWAHEQGVPGKVVAQLMGHAKVDTTLNVYTQVVDGALRTAVDKIGSGLFTIVHNPEGAAALSH
jgi:integrase